MNTGWTARAGFLIFRTHVLRNHPFHPQEICTSFGRIQSKYLSWCAGIALAAAGFCHANDFSAQRQLVENLSRLTESPAKLEQQGGQWHATATLPDGTTAWFINVHSGALVSSSDFQETSAPSQ